MAYACVRTDNMSGTKNPTDLVSVKYQVSGTDTAIENGNVVLVGAKATGEREARLATAPAANSALADVALIASPELLRDERMHNLDEFINAAGELARGYRFKSSNYFSITAEAFEAAATVAVGDVVELQAKTKFKVVAAATGLTSGSTQVGNIYAIETVGAKTYYVVEVI